MFLYSYFLAGNSRFIYTCVLIYILNDSDNMQLKIDQKKRKRKGNHPSLPNQASRAVDMKQHFRQGPRSIPDLHWVVFIGRSILKAGPHAHWPHPLMVS